VKRGTAPVPSTSGVVIHLVALPAGEKGMSTLPLLIMAAGVFVLGVEFHKTENVPAGERAMTKKRQRRIIDRKIGRQKGSVSV
jgi:hypothetical protein